MTPREPSNAWLREMLQQNDDKHEEAHHRIRTDHRLLEVRVETLHAELTAMKVLLAQQTARMDDAKGAPIDVGKIMFNPKMVMGIVGLVVSIITGNYFTNAPIRDDLRDVKDQVGSLKADVAQQSERATAVQAAIDELKRAMELRRLEIQSVSNDLQQMRRGK